MLEQNVDCDLLLVDEAAAILAALLRQLQQKYQRVVYATTIHGYEGSGHGFELRMSLAGFALAALAADNPTTPLRWAVSDPLEPLLANILLLMLMRQRLYQPSHRRRSDYSRSVLLNCYKDEALLRQLFGLLVLAHYQTSPTDLRLLLDCGYWIWLWRDDIALYGVALLMREGPIDSELAGSRSGPGGGVRGSYYRKLCWHIVVIWPPQLSLPAGDAYCRASGLSATGAGQPVYRGVNATLSGAG